MKTNFSFEELAKQEAHLKKERDAAMFSWLSGKEPSKKKSETKSMHFGKFSLDIRIEVDYTNQTLKFLEFPDQLRHKDAFDAKIISGNINIHIVVHSQSYPALTHGKLFLPGFESQSDSILLTCDRTSYHDNLVDYVNALQAYCNHNKVNLHITALNPATKYAALTPAGLLNEVEILVGLSSSTLQFLKFPDHLRGMVEFDYTTPTGAYLQLLSDSSPDFSNDTIYMCGTTIKNDDKIITIPKTAIYSIVDVVEIIQKWCNQEKISLIVKYV